MLRSKRSSVPGRTALLGRVEIELRGELIWGQAGKEQVDHPAEGEQVLEVETAGQETAQVGSATPLT